MASTGNADVVKSQVDSAKQLDFEKDSSDKATADVIKQVEKFESKEYNDDATDKREKTGETVNANEDREPVEEEPVEEKPRVGIVGSAPVILAAARGVFNSLPKIAAAIEIGNDIKNEGLTKDVVDKGTEFVTIIKESAAEKVNDIKNWGVTKDN